MKIFNVGGSVRDKLMGLNPKDFDYVVVLDNTENTTIEQGYSIMKNYLIAEGFTIWLETESMFTIRAKFPTNYKFKGDADFVLARKELGYDSDSRRPRLVLGSLYDDLARRDFTVNAMAEDEDGVIYDPFGGKKDLENKLLRTPLPAVTTFLDDPLRAMRAFRFKVTKGFKFHREIYKALNNTKVLEKYSEVVSKERTREELFKMFKHDSIFTMKLLIEADKDYCEGILDICFGKDGMWLKPTFEK